MAKDPYRPLDYLVLPVAALRAATGGLPAETLGILLQLFLRAATELSGGRIEHADTTTTAPRCNIPGLWHWEGDALILDIYPAEYEAKALAKRLCYAANAQARHGKEKSRRTFNNAADASHAIASSTACNCMQNDMQLHEGTMQLHDSGCNCMQLNMQLQPCAHVGAIYDKNKFMGGDSARIRASNAPHETLVVPTTPPPFEDENFKTWWRLIAATHPSGKLMRQLPADILQAALNAYQAIPAAAEYAALLEAYMASRLQKNKYGERFFRASGVARYFDTLADHINHAERWAVETGYHRKQAAKAPPKTKPAPPPDPADTISESDLKNFFETIRKNERPEPPEHPAEPTTEPTETPTGMG